MSDDERGSAAVEFVLIAGLLVFLFMAVLQVIVYFYARIVVAASAADAARYTAAAGVAVEAGAARAQRLAAQGLDDEDATALRCTSASDRDVASGLPTVTVRCREQLRLLFLPLGTPLVIDVRSSAVKEGRP